MNAIQIIARTDDTVTLRVADFDALVAKIEDAEDMAALFEAGAREEALGRIEARADHLPVERVMGLLDGEHPVRIWREHRGLSSTGLAEAAGVSRSYLADIETGKKPGSMAAYRDLATALRVTIDSLVKSSNDRDDRAVPS